MSRRGTASAVAAGLALVLLVVSGRATLLVRPWFTPVLVATGLLVMVASLRHRVELSRGGVLLLLAPVAVGVALTPSVVGRVSQGAADPATLTERLGDPANPLLTGRGGDVTLLQILLAEQQVGGVALAGRSVTVEAIVAGPHRLSRSVIVCCAADAQSVSVTETGATLPDTQSWVRVTGKLATRGDKTVLDAVDVTRISTPANPFL
jgi:hypothetical protein